jgi:hypothetical protein
MDHKAEGALRRGPLPVEWMVSHAVPIDSGREK